jgi:hypothetical protein
MGTYMFKRILILAALSLAATPTLADEAAFYGKWKITAAVTAPWEDPAHPMVTDDVERYGGKIVDIETGKLTGPDLLGCGATELSVEKLPYAGLFEGGLGADPKDPGGKYDEAKAKRLAEGLGYTAEPVETLFQGCSEISLHRMNDRTLQFGLDNRIFTLEKQ